MCISLEYRPRIWDSRGLKFDRALDAACCDECDNFRLRRCPYQGVTNCPRYQQIKQQRQRKRK